jgi:nitrilase
VPPFRAAVVQAGPVVFDVPRTLDKLRDLTADAARRGARLAVFSEAFVSAYPKGLGSRWILTWSAITRGRTCFG